MKEPKEKPFGAKYNNRGQCVEFNVVRSKWVNGTTDSNRGGSALRNSAGFQCCLGFYARACGYKTNEILGKGFLAVLQGKRVERMVPLSYVIVRLNDLRLPHAKEKLLAEEFAKSGVKVNFID
jgi:hypothetical protein